MRTKLDPDDEFFIPEMDVTDPEWRHPEATQMPGQPSGILIDGAVGYALRLIPSNKVLCRFATTVEAWPVIIATIEAGRSPRTLSLDWIAGDGASGSISAGPRLEALARVMNGEPHPYPSPTRRESSARRVAEGVA